MSRLHRIYEFFQKNVLSEQAGMWVAIGILIGITAGVGSLILYNLIRIISDLLLTGVSGFNPPLPGAEGGTGIYSYGTYSRFLIPVSTTLGGLISGYLVYKLSPGSEGLGINAAINAFHNLTVKIKNKTPAVKLVSSAVVIGSGGSAGRDGPVALISAVFGSYLADLFRLNDHDRRIVMASAIGAGIGSIFMAPIGGAIMSTEILYRKDFEVEALIPATIASVVGYLIFGFQFHYHALFTTAASSFLFQNAGSIAVYSIIGLFAGLGGKFYVKTFDVIHLAFLRLKRLPVYVKPAIGGLLVGIVALEFPEVLGLGYGWVQIILSDNGNLASISTLPFTLLETFVILFFVKILATSFSIGSGGSGGAFAPSIVTGAFMGVSLGLVLHNIFPFVTIDEMTIVTMISFFAGVSKTPVSMLIMGTEMVGGLDMFLPLVIAITISYFVSGARTSVYNAQVMDRLHSPAHMFEYRQDLLGKISVSDAMKRDYVSATPDMTVGEISFRIRSRNTKGAVIMMAGIPEGYVTASRIQENINLANRPVSDISKGKPVTIGESQTLADSLHILPPDPEESIIVTEDRTGNIVGTLSFNEIADAYEKSFRAFKVAEMSQKSQVS